MQHTDTQTQPKLLLLPLLLLPLLLLPLLLLPLLLFLLLFLLLHRAARIETHTPYHVVEQQKQHFPKSTTPEQLAG